MKNNKLVLELNKNKYKYIFLITIIVLGIISGIILSNILSYNDKKMIGENINIYFSGLKNGEKINYFANLLNSLGVNLLYFILLFIFGISIVGIVLNPFLLYFKSLIIGFTLGIMISLYSYSGIVLGIFSIFPHQVVNLIIYLLLSFYGMNLSYKLFSFLFFKKQFNVVLFRKKYIKILGLSCITLVVSSFYEVFLGDFILKLFTFLIN